jgi:AraC family transcriptional regulator of arabinose operon
MVVIPKRLIRKYSDKEMISNLQLTDIGHFPHASHHFRERPNGCPEYILIYCVEGEGFVTFNGNRYSIRPNSFYIIEQNQPHTYYSNNNDPWSIYWVHFTGSYSASIYKKFWSLSSGNPVFIPFSENKVSEFEYILELFKHGYTDQVFEYSSMLMHKLLGSFIYYSLRSTNGKGAANDSMVKNIIEFLNENMHKSLTVQDIAHEFHKSPSTLFSLFKNKTGYSIMHFYSLIKVQKASEMMNFTNLSIKEISYKLDFQDPLYFSRVFKKFMGMPPSQYRKDVSSDSNSESSVR